MTTQQELLTAKMKTIEEEYMAYLISRFDELRNLYFIEIQYTDYLDKIKEHKSEIGERMKQIEKAEETIDELMPGVNPVCIIHHNEVSDLCTIGSARYEMYLNICADDLRKRQNSLEEEDEDDATNLIKRLCIEIRVGIEYLKKR